VAELFVAFAVAHLRSLGVFDAVPASRPLQEPEPAVQPRPARTPRNGATANGHRAEPQPAAANGARVAREPAVETTVTDRVRPPVPRARAAEPGVGVPPVTPRPKKPPVPGPTSKAVLKSGSGPRSTRTARPPSGG